MLYTVHFNYLEVLKFSMIVDAESIEKALIIVKSAIADDRVFTFSQASPVKLGCIQVKDIQSHFSVEEVESNVITPSRYSIVFEDEDDIPTKPDRPNMILLGKCKE